MLLPAILPGVGFDPLTALTPPPGVTTHRLTYAAGVVDADVYTPGGNGPAAGLLLQYQGPRPVERRDPTLVRFAEGLSRLGMVVVVPESSSLSAGRVVPEEREAVARAYELLLEQPRVDASRTGIVGFSIGGSISLIAAAEQESIRRRVRVVNTLGSYFDARTLLVDVVSRSMLVDREVRPWAPSSQALEILGDLLVSTLPEGSDRALLERVQRGGRPLSPAEQEGLGPSARLTEKMLRGDVSRQEAEALAAQLPAATQERLLQLSPSRFLDQLEARLLVMHDEGDGYVPFPHSRQLALAAGLRTGRMTEFSIFSHILPDRQVPWTIFARDAWALYWHTHALLLELL